jgi:hypothetical protein
MSITTLGVALALITGALGAFLYIEHEQTVNASAKATSAQVVCQADETRLVQAKIIGESPSAIRQAASAVKTDCAYAQAAVKARDVQENATAKKLQSIQNALLDQGDKKDSKHVGQ